MAKRKKTKTDAHTFIGIKLTGFNARVDASINYIAQIPHFCTGDEKAYCFESHLEIDGVATYPKALSDAPFRISLRGYELKHDDSTLTLNDFHALDEDGSRKYRKVRNKEVPVYDMPKGIGLLERQRGSKVWCGNVWVKPQTISDMLALLPHISPLYISLHEHKIERHRRIVGLTLQTTDPAEE